MESGLSGDCAPPTFRGRAEEDLERAHVTDVGVGREGSAWVHAVKGGGAEGLREVLNREVDPAARSRRGDRT